LEVFSGFNQNLEPIIKNRALQGAYDADIKELIASSTIKDTIYIKYLKQFLLSMAKRVITDTLAAKSLEGYGVEWRILYFGFKIINIE
jgi:hypothetical protein